jgi:anti-sigma regulatory factor (Ser/Thr protein kinase)
MMNRDYCFELKSKLSELQTLCRHLEDCGDVMELPQKCLLEINLGLDELFTNIISYGFGDESEHQIKFSLAKDRETLVVQVEDDGIPFNPLDAAGPAVSQDLDSINIGGLGIHLVKKVMDDIDYQRVEGKNKLILKKCVEAA